MLSLHWKLYISSLIGTIFFYGFILWLCYTFPFLIVFSVLTFFWFFYNRTIKDFLAKWSSKFFFFSKKIILFACFFSWSYADIHTWILWLADPSYEVREMAQKLLLEAGKTNPYGVLQTLQIWKAYPDLELQERLLRLEKMIQCETFTQKSLPLAQQILRLVRQNRLEEADELCRTFKKNNGVDQGEDIAYLHEQIAALCYLRFSLKTDLESRYWDISEKGIRYHHLYLFFLARGEVLTSFAQVAETCYDERIQAGPMHRTDDNLKKIYLRSACLNFSIGQYEKAQERYEEFQKILGNVAAQEEAFYYTTVGKKNQAFETLLKAIDEGGYETWISILSEYTFWPLQSDPRFDLIYTLKPDKEWEPYLPSDSDSKSVPK